MPVRPNEPGLVFVYLGKELPPHLPEAVAQARHFNRDSAVFVAAERSALAERDAFAGLDVTALSIEELGLSDEQRRFRRISRLDRAFRDGFFTYAAERFFVLERVARAFDMKGVIHAENDVMLYFDFARMAATFATLYSNLAAPFPNDDLCVASVVYAKDADALVPLLEFINSRVGRRFRREASEMEIIARYRRKRGKAFFDNLPTVPRDYPRPLRSRNGRTERELDYSNCFEALGGVFDASAFGQYLGGIDPRNTVEKQTIGFINDESLIDPSRCRVAFERDEQGRRRPTMSCGARTWPIYNLHVHSKSLSLFAS